jgi:radical SAM enzyme (TIGR01210 family)
VELYPSSLSARDRFVLERRLERPTHDPWQPQGVLVEEERGAEGGTVRVATVFLTGRECPWRCVMCDLWQYTIEADTPAGAIPAQIAAARNTLALRGERATHAKLYNAGSFFDPRAVPEADYDAIAGALVGFTRLIVESHPSLVGARTQAFVSALDRRGGDTPPSLEVAMGLETAHPAALDHLNKRMTVALFLRAAERLQSFGVSLRVFLLVHPPFVAASDQDEWLERSVDVACGAGATAVSLIPTRTGNGALDALASDGAFRSPRLADLERSVEIARARAGAGCRVFADLWNLDRFASCRACLEARRARLHRMNIEQRTLPPIGCVHCASADPR